MQFSLKSSGKVQILSLLLIKGHTYSFSLIRLRYPLTKNKTFALLRQVYEG